jgi:glucose-6-phosphate 1-dehydrogenase
VPECRNVGTSLDDLDDEGFRAFARTSLDEFARHGMSEPEWASFAASLTFVSQGAGPAGLAEAVARQEHELGGEPRRLHYLSIPPNAARDVVAMLGEAGLVDRARIIMEKPSAPTCQLDRAEPRCTRPSEHQIFRIDHFSAREAASTSCLGSPTAVRTDLEPSTSTTCRSTCLTLSLGHRAPFYETTGAYRYMVVTHLFQVLAFMAMEPPTALEPRAISEEKNKVFRSLLPIEPRHVVRGQYAGYLDERGVAAHSDTETFIALRCEIDNWRWAGVPFFLRTGKRLAEGARIISIAFREPPKSMFPPGSGVGAQGTDHLTFDLADASKLSLSFYGKRPGPGLKLDKLSLQFALHETGRSADVLEAYERLIYDAMSGDHTLFTTAEGIERLWELSTPLLRDPPPVRPYPPGSWGPNAIHQLIAPYAWRLPFERTWREQ